MCSININNEYDNILFKLNFLNRESKNLGKERQNLFYFTCIPIRFLILFFLFGLSQVKNETFQKFLRGILILVYFVSIIHLVSKKSKCQWWYNEYEIILSILAILICIFIQENTVFYVSIIFLMSILGGIIQSIYLKPFENLSNESSRL